MQVNGITWHAVTLEDDAVESYNKFAKETLGLQPMMQMEGTTVYMMPNGTILEVYDKSKVPPYGYNGSVAFGFRVEDIDAAVSEVKAAGYEVLGDIVRVPEMKYAYVHFKGPDGLVYGMNEQK
jgi:predicted enzyme related to lactoylglutathione lyase